MSPEVYARFAEVVARRLPPGPRTVLEIGAGGWTLLAIPDFASARRVAVNLRFGTPSPDLLRAERVVANGNALPFADASFDGAMCTVSVDYLVRPLEVFGEVARVLRPGAPFACTFSNRCFPTKAIRGWLATDDEFHVQLVAEYFRRSAGWDEPRIDQRPTPRPGDPLFAVWAHRSRLL